MRGALAISRKMNQVHIWLRAETKANEKRSALTPTVAEELLKAGIKVFLFNVIIKGFKVTVEKCTQRIFRDTEFEK